MTLDKRHGRFELDKSYFLSSSIKKAINEFIAADPEQEACKISFEEITNDPVFTKLWRIMQ